MYSNFLNLKCITTDVTCTKRLTADTAQSKCPANKERHNYAFNILYPTTVLNGKKWFDWIKLGPVTV